MDYKIEKIEEKDIDFIYDMGMKIKDFSADGGENKFWPKETILNLINSQNDVTLKLIVENKIVGFSFVMIHNVTKKAIIENFYILDEYYNFSEIFLKKVEEEIKEREAQFFAYFFDLKDDCNNIELFESYFKGNEHLWLHKNINFENKL